MTVNENTVTMSRLAFWQGVTAALTLLGAWWLARADVASIHEDLSSLRVMATDNAAALQEMREELKELREKAPIVVNGGRAEARIMAEPGGGFVHAYLMEKYGAAIVERMESNGM